MQQVEVREDAALAWPVARPTGVWRLHLRGGDRRALVATGDLVCLALALGAAAITPVPGGVGPMTIACLLRNTLQAACSQGRIDLPRELAA